MARSVTDNIQQRIYINSKSDLATNPHTLLQSSSLLAAMAIWLGKNKDFSFVSRKDKRILSEKEVLTDLQTFH